MWSQSLIPAVSGQLDALRQPKGAGEHLYPFFELYETAEAYKYTPLPQPASGACWELAKEIYASRPPNYYEEVLDTLSGFNLSCPSLYMLDLLERAGHAGKLSQVLRALSGDEWARRAMKDALESFLTLPRPLRSQSRHPLVRKGSVGRSLSLSTAASLTPPHLRSTPRYRCRVLQSEEATLPCLFSIRRVLAIKHF
ncbi:MAG: hypothetical protein KVP17_001240 [Porospora cf. gigantea B]|uniref:uncharacterized protein n=1 Tax=Porospora cf. gigantea B TaxID=2853592 RepID=UPI003571A439|nr:MAG: hypothetical protein KVP17_001240 [Porospora cf. gigantea B]